VSRLQVWQWQWGYGFPEGQCVICWVSFWQIQRVQALGGALATLPVSSGTCSLIKLGVQIFVIVVRFLWLVPRSWLVVQTLYASNQMLRNFWVVTLLMIHKHEEARITYRIVLSLELALIKYSPLTTFFIISTLHVSGSLYQIIGPSLIVMHQFLEAISNYLFRDSRIKPNHPRTPLLIRSMLTC